MSTETATTKQETLEGLATDLASIVGQANANDDALGKAREKHDKGTDQSIRALASRVAAINVPLDKDDIAVVLSSMEAKIPGNAQTKKVRKSETKLVLEQRTHIGGVIQQLDKEVASRASDAKAVNIRAATLKCLRELKKPRNGIESPEQAVRHFIAGHDYEKDDVEKMTDLLDRLDRTPELQVSDDIGEKRPHELLGVMREAILAAVGGDNQMKLDAVLAGLEAHDNAGAPEEVQEAPEPDAVPEGVEFEDVAPEPAQPAAEHTEEPIEVSDDTSPSRENKEAELVMDMGSFMTGVLE